MEKESSNEGRPFLVLLAVSLVSSFLYFLSFRPASLGPLGWVALAPLFWAMAEATPRRAASISACSGLLFGLLCLPSFRYLTIAAYLAPAVLAAGYYALVGMGVSYATSRRCLPLPLVAPPFWIAYEYIRSTVPGIKFPWLLAGQSQVEWLTVIQVLDIGGVYLLSFVVVLLNAAIAHAVRAWRDPERRKGVYASFGVSIALVGATLLYGTIRVRTIEVAAGPKVGIVQGNIPQGIKLSSPGQRMLGEYLHLSQQILSERPSLIVWPETMYPWRLQPDEWDGFSPDEQAELARARNSLLEIARQGDARLLIGALSYSGDEMHNTAYFISEKGETLGRYDKIDLVPLGEFIPLERVIPPLATFIRNNFLPPGFGRMTPGEEIPLFEHEGFRFSVSICYEISFAWHSREARARGADFLVSISNDGWFRDGPELDMARDQAVFRAVENRVGIARAANTGISSFVEPTGHSEILTDRSGRRKEISGTLVRRMAVSPNRTVYLAIGDLFAWIVLIASIFILLPLNRLRKGRSPSQP